jgi:hypothetical protein
MFATLLMKKKNKPHSIFKLCSAVFMITALLWLTISTPFVYQFQQKQIEQNKIAKSEQTSIADTNNEEESNPFGTEEKNPNSGNTLAEEYLHEFHIHDQLFSIVSREHRFENVDTYIAFHGELDVPPPDVA